MSSHFVPVKIHIKEQPQTFERFAALWTPTIVILDPDGVERHRIEGFLTAEDFLAELEVGRGKVAFARGDYAAANRIFASVRDQFPKTSAAPPAVYWEGVAGYKSSKDPNFLKDAASRLKETYSQSEWATKSSVWLGS